MQKKELAVETGYEATLSLIVRGTTLLNSAITDIQQASKSKVSFLRVQSCTSFYRTRGMGVEIGQ